VIIDFKTTTTSLSRKQDRRDKEKKLTK